MRKSTIKVGRSAAAGRFASVEKARRQRKTHVVETIKKPKPGKMG